MLLGGGEQSDSAMVALVHGYPVTAPDDRYQGVTPTSVSGPASRAPDG